MSAEAKRNYGKSILILAVISSISKVFGFFRDIILANVYGATTVADAYSMTLSVPDLILVLMTNTIMIGFVPIAVAKLSESPRMLNEFTTATTKIMSVVAVVLAALIAALAEPIVALLAPGFDAEGMALSVTFLRIVSLTVVFKTLANILHAYLNTTKYFTPNAFLGIILDVAIIALILLSKRLDMIYLLPVGTVLGTLLQTIFLYPFAKKKGFKLLLRSKIDWKSIKQLLILSIPALMAVGLLQISGLFNKTLASGMGEGSVTLLTNATRISFFAESVIVSSIATVLYPLLSEYHLAGEQEKIKDALANAVEKIVTFLLPATVGLALLSQPIIEILYGSGEFTSENIAALSELMTYNVIGIVGLAVQTVLTRALFSMKRVKLSIIMSSSLLVVYLGSSWLFSHFFGLPGLAIASAVSYTVGGVAYYIVLNKICGNIHAKSTALVFLKAAVSCAVMGGAVWAFDTYVPIHPIASLALSIVLGVLVYAAMAAILKLKHFNIVVLCRRVFKKLKSMFKRAPAPAVAQATAESAESATQAPADTTETVVETPTDSTQAGEQTPAEPAPASANEATLEQDEAAKKDEE